MSYTGLGQLSPGKKVPVELKKAKGTYRSDRDEGKIEMEIMEGVPLPPEHFSDEEKQEWNVVCNFLNNCGILFEVSLNIIEAYCIEWTTYRKATDNIKEKGIFITELDRRDNLVTKRNPAVDVANISFTKIMSIAGHFGFTPAAATRIKTPGKQKEIKDPDFNF